MGELKEENIITAKNLGWGCAKGLEEDDGVRDVDGYDFCHVVGEVGCKGVGDETTPIVTNLRGGMITIQTMFENN